MAPPAPDEVEVPACPVAGDWPFDDRQTVPGRRRLELPPVLVGARRRGGRS